MFVKLGLRGIKVRPVLLLLLGSECSLNARLIWCQKTGTHLSDRSVHCYTRISKLQMLLLQTRDFQKEGEAHTVDLGLTPIIPP